MEVEEYARLINDAKKMLPWHRSYLDELLKYYVELTPKQRKEIFLDRGFRDPLYIRFVRPRDREHLLQLCKEKNNES